MSDDTVPILVLRHAQTDWNAHGYIQGHTDVGLSEFGRRQARSWVLPEEFDDFEWTVSPLARAVQTAQLLGASKIATEPRLKEMRWGAWEGRRLADLRAELGEQMSVNERRGLDFRPPGGESPREVRDRLADWLSEVADCGSPRVVVSHKGVIRVMLTMATGWNMRGKPPHRLQWSCAHLFALPMPPALIRIDKLNIPISGPRS